MKTLEHGSLLVSTMPVGPFAMNTYLIGCSETKRAAVIDSGGESQAMVDEAARLGLTIELLLQTHAHIDHVAGLAEMKRLTAAPIYLHPADRRIYESAAVQGRFFGISVAQPPPPDHELTEGQVIPVGNIALRALHTPGHCPGHVAFYAAEQGVLFGGDLLFRGSIGRVDLPGADAAAMKKSLDRIVEELPDDVVIHPGHMESTTLAREKSSNPFLNGLW